MTSGSSPSAAASLLSARNLAVGRGGRAVVRDIDFDLAPGELVGLIGPNGAGKSTFLATLSGVLEPVQGRVFLLDRELPGYRPRARARILTYLPQNPGEDDAFTVAQLVAIGRTPHVRPFSFGTSRSDERAIAVALERAGASAWADRPLGTLSGGQRQRVRIAMALAQEPMVLLADEPTSALDLSGQLDLMLLLADLAHQGLGVLAVLHDLNLAAQFCTRLVLFSDGRIQGDGPPAAVLSEESIARAYGVAVQIAHHPRSGAPYLLPRIALNRPSRSSRIHLVAGGGSGRRLIPKLADMGYELSVGVLDAMDSDQQLAADCRVPTLTEAPFAPISETSVRLLGDILETVDAVVVAPCPFGPGNLLNLEAIAQTSVPVYLVAPPTIAERDFSGGRATMLYEQLERNGARVLSEDELLARFQAATTRPLRESLPDEGTSASSAPSRSSVEPGHRAAERGAREGP